MLIIYNLFLTETLQPNTHNNLKRESNSISVPHSATATLPQNNNSSIITGPSQSGQVRKLKTIFEFYQNNKFKLAATSPLAAKSIPESASA